LWFNPCLPPQLKSLQFDICYRHHWINVQITGERLRVGTRSLKAASVKIGFKEQVFDLEPGATRKFELQYGADEES
jgi:trehalose/maltose hydrolase-like predicted phosphorylase